VCVDGVTADVLTHSTTNQTVTEPVNYLLSLPLQRYAPGDLISYDAPGGDDYGLTIKENNITSLTFTLKDENDALFTSADFDTLSEYNMVLRIDTLKADTMQRRILQALNSVIDYLRLIFVGNHMGK
jgi:hypothetical protein